MKLLLFLLVLTMSTLSAEAQSLYFTRNGKASFFSKTALENIDAVNNEVFSVINLDKGEIAFAILIKSFRFERALMEEHFNENYMESTKYPKATFSGKITDLNKIDMKKDGTYPVKAVGDITIHGVTRNISVPSKISIAGGSIQATARFQLKIKDFNITIPSLVADKIAETVDVSIECNYTPKENK